MDPPKRGIVACGYGDGVDLHARRRYGVGRERIMTANELTIRSMKVMLGAGGAQRHGGPVPTYPSRLNSMIPDDFRPFWRDARRIFLQQGGND